MVVVVENLLELPIEILIQIFQLCSKVDLINIACSNKECYYLVIHFLCRYFEIRWSDIVSTSTVSNKLRNLRYSTCLVFYNGDNPFYSGPPWDDINRNYLRILKFCTPEKLKTLYIIKSKITDSTLQTTLKLFRNIQNLRLEDCSDVTTLSLTYLGNLSSLRRLHVNSCDITDYDISKLTQLPQLGDLSIVLCPKITETSLKHVSRIITLQRFQYCEYGLQPPNGFTNLANLTKLKTLDIGGCLIRKDELLYVIRSLTSLNILNIGGTEITNADLSHILNIVSLTRLGLAGCGITDEKIDILHHLKSLKVLDLSWHEDITDVGMSYISKITSLRSLSLRFCNKITDDGISYLRLLPFLEVLDVSVCELLTDLTLITFRSFPSLKVVHVNECTEITNHGISYLKSIRNVKFEERDFHLEDRENLSSM